MLHSRPATPCHCQQLFPRVQIKRFELQDKSTERSFLHHKKWHRTSERRLQLRVGTLLTLNIVFSWVFLPKMREPEVRPTSASALTALFNYNHLDILSYNTFYPDTSTRDQTTYRSFFTNSPQKMFRHQLSYLLSYCQISITEPISTRVQFQEFESSTTFIKLKSEIGL